MPVATWTFEVDWNNNGSFADANDNISADVMEASWTIGRDYASQLTGKSTSLVCTLKLKNDSNKYSSFNSVSPIFGNILPKRKIRIQGNDGITTRTMLIGYLESLIPEPASYGLGNRAVFRATGPLNLIASRFVNVSMSTNVLTGAAINEVLDKIGWPSGTGEAARDIDPGQTTIARFFTRDKRDALNLIREVEVADNGFVRESKDGKIVFEDRSDRVTSPKTVSQATFSDATGASLAYFEVKQEDPLKEIYNIIEAEVIIYTVGSLAVLWTLAESGANSLLLQSGESISRWANFPNSNSATDAVAVDVWTTPVATTDYLFNSQSDGLGSNLTSQIGIVATKFDTAMKITITNNGPSAGYLTLLQARGTPVTESNPIRVKAEDSASKTDFGERTWPLSTAFIPTSVQAQAYCDYLLGIYKAPIPVLMLRFSATKNQAFLTEALTRDVSDRITIVANNKSGLGVNEDFFVESISHTIRPREHIVEYRCSPAQQSGGGYWVLGTSKFEVDARLFY